MKLPIPKEEGGKRMTTMMSAASTGRKDLLCESQETSLIDGRAARGVQFRSNMDLGSGDPSDYYNDIQSHYDSFNWDTRFESHDFPTTQSTIINPPTSGVSSTPPPQPLKSSTEKVLSYSSESINKHASNEKLDHEKFNADNLFKGRENQLGHSNNSTLAVVEDSKQSSFTANESNPTVPAPTEPSKTSTLRLSDRTRSESEDDIEKLDEPEQDVAFMGQKTLYKTSATPDNSPNSEKIEKNGNRPDLDQNDIENDCVVQCLYYTIQCCECVIF